MRTENTRGKLFEIAHWSVFALLVLITNQISPVCLLFGWSSPRRCELGMAPIQIGILVIITLWTLGRIHLRGEGSSWISAWKKNWLLGLFILLAACSVGWTVSVPITVQRVILILLLGGAASYYGFNLSSRGLVFLVMTVIGGLALASVLLAVARPDLAIMSNYPYQGLWRGVFWHKIYFGAVMALGYIASLVIAFSSRVSFPLSMKITAGIMSVIFAWLAYLSDSASGLVVIVLQTILLAAVVLWRSWGGRITRRVVWILGGMMVLAGVFILNNLGFVFGLFNRSANMTGRVPLWSFLFEEYVSKQPWFGYGFGAFWYQPGINQQVQSVVGWPYPVGVSDSGYMDILLGLGVAGLVLIASILISASWRAFKRLKTMDDLPQFFPIFVLVHVVFINISLSYFLESESFLWFLMLLVLFVISGERQQGGST